MNNPNQRYQFGTALIWLGVLAWAPYFVLRLNGSSPSLWAFLPFHLVGVIGGGRLRATARRQLGIPAKKRKGYRLVAHWLMIASILVWLLYYGLKIAGLPVSLSPFLTVHLTGVLGGTGLMALGSAIETYQKRKRAGAYGIGHPTEETSA